MKRNIAITLLIFLFSSVVWAQETPTDISLLKKHSFGAGLGIPYGILGINVDVNAAPNFYFSGGIGYALEAGIGYNIGIKYFVLPIQNSFRPRVSVNYGTNTIVKYKYLDNKSYAGLNVGIGVQWMWGETKSNGLDLDVFYLATSSYDRFDDSDNGRVKISIGYRRAF